MYPKKFEQLKSMKKDERLSYFIRKVCDFEEVWGLDSNGWVIENYYSGEKIIRFWPEYDFLKIAKSDFMSEASEKKIPLEDFLNIWLPEMGKNQLSAAIFPVPNDEGFLIKSSILMDKIHEELNQYK